MATEVLKVVQTPALAEGAPAPARAVPGHGQTAEAPPRAASSGAHAGTPIQDTEPPRETLERIAKHIEDYLRRSGRELEFSVDEETGRTVITVRDTATDAVIRQIPGEEILRIARALGTQPHLLIDVLA